MSEDAALYREFEQALAAVLADTEYNLARRNRLANARAKVNSHDPRYYEAVNQAFPVLK